ATTFRKDEHETEERALVKGFSSASQTPIGKIQHCRKLIHVPFLGLQRCGKGCRLRWMNYLRPNVKRGNISTEEEELIIRLHKLLGN
ncbi:hypothetical protein KI387_015472, partial [Taxus chinensis]